MVHEIIVNLLFIWNQCNCDMADKWQRMHVIYWHCISILFVNLSCARTRIHWSNSVRAIRFLLVTLAHSPCNKFTKCDIMLFISMCMNYDVMVRLILHDQTIHRCYWLRAMVMRPARQCTNIERQEGMDNNQKKKRNKNEFSEAFRRRSHPKIINLSYVTINIIVQLCLRSTIENILMHAFDYEPIRTIDSKLQSIIHYMVTSCWYHNLHDEWRSLFDYIRVRNIFHHPHPIWPLSKCSIVRHGCGLPNPFRLAADLLHNFADDNRYRHVQKTRRGDEDEKWEQCRQWRQRRQ